MCPFTGPLSASLVGNWETFKESCTNFPMDTGLKGTYVRKISTISVLCG